MKPIVRCTATCRNGTPCGKVAVKGETRCSVHLSANPAANLTAPLTPQEVLEKLMVSADESIRLRASEKILDRMDKKIYECSRCRHAEREAQQSERFLDALNEEELVAFSEFIKQWISAHKAFRERVYARLPDLRPDNDPPPRPKPTPEEQAKADAEQAKANERHSKELLADIKRERVPPQLAPEEKPDAVETSSRLDPAFWPSVGIYERDGIPSTTFGNEDALDIIEGRISLEAARRRHEEHQNILKGNANG
jgi:hypothetical protein